MLPTVTARAVPRGRTGPRAGRRAPDDGQPTSRTPLLLRVPGAVLATLLLGTTFHVVAGAAMPPPAAVLRTAAVLAVLWVAVCRNELSLRQLVTAVWASQAVVHFMLAPQHLGVLAASASPCPMPGGAEPDGVAQGSAALLAGDTGWQALVAHGVAGLLTACWLRCGERRVWAAARRTVRGFLALLTPLLAGGPRPRLAGFAVVSEFAASARRWTACQRRGPPRYVTAC